MASMQFENETNPIKRKEKFINNLDIKNSEVYIYGNCYLIHTGESNRNYIVDNNGNIKIDETDIMSSKVNDEHPGELETIGTNELQINSIEDLVAFSNNVNKGNAYGSNISNTPKKIKLGKNLDFKSELSYANIEKKYKYDSESETYIEDSSADKTLMELCTTGIGFIPIGAKNFFSGIFDGNNKEIKNIYILRDTEAGLFANTNYSYVKIENLTIDGNITSNNGAAGGIVAIFGGGTSGDIGINNCTNNSNVTGCLQAGGIVGTQKGNSVLNIEKCINNVEIVCTGEYTSGWSEAHKTAAGGIIGGGFSNFNINKCNVYGKIEGPTSGGIVGGKHMGQEAKIVNCFVKAQIGSIDNKATIAGGIIGSMCSANDLIIYNCKVSENTNIFASDKSGGITGIVTWGGTPSIYNSYSLASINSKYAGGISYKSAIIENCYFGGNITADYVGGISYENSTCKNCYYIDTINSGIYNVADNDETKILVMTENDMKENDTLLNKLKEYTNDSYELSEWTKKENEFPMLNN